METLSISHVFESLQSTGTLVLLYALLLISMLVGWFHGRRINTLDRYLYSPGEMKGWEFGLSETAYMTAVGSTILFLSSLTVQYGLWFLVVVVVSWSLSLYVYGKLALSGDLIEFFRKTGAHLGQYIVGRPPELSRSRAEQALVTTSSIIIGLTFFGYYFTEILALRIFSQSAEPHVQVSVIVGAAVALTIVYTTIGGYKGTFKTDVIQTLFLVMALLVIFIAGWKRLGDEEALAPVPFMKTGIAEALILLVSYSLIGIASLVTGLDIWARMRASEGRDAREGRKGLYWSFVTLMPFLLICGFGVLFMLSGATASVGSQSDSYEVITAVTKTAGVPLGFLMVLLIVVAISTADTSLITISQAIEPLLKKRFRTVSWFRLLALVISAAGLAVALAIPISKTIQAIFLTISFPVALTPIVFLRRFSKRRSVNPALSVVSMVGGSVIGLGLGIARPEYASYSAMVILVTSCLIYGIGLMVSRATSRESEVKE